MKTRTATKGSFQNGHIPSTAVLTPQNAVEIRQLYASKQNVTMLDIAIEYGISVAHVSDIVNYKKWKNAEQQIKKQ